MKCYVQALIVVLVLLASCSETTRYKDTVPPHDEFTIESVQVGETRHINVWTPPAYKGSTDSLPVLYMADGGIVEEDFPHVANTLAELVAAKKIPPIILVGIANTQRKRDLTGPTVLSKDMEIAPVVGGAATFRAFIKEELFAEIAQRYRITKEKSIIGESLSGLFVVECFLLAPDMFDHYIAFDPSLWWNDEYLIQSAKEHLAQFPETEKRLWLAGSADMLETVAKLAAVLNAEQLPNIKWQYSAEPTEQHSSIFKATKEKALIWTFGRGG